MKKKEYLVMLSAPGNPDYQQYADVANPTSIRVPTLKAAKEICGKYIEDWNLGGGNWGWQSGRVYHAIGDKCKLAGRFSYNLRFWRSDRSIKKGK